jgi:hypothetical protein
MNKQIALAYGIAGLAVAAALVSMVFATTQETLTQEPITNETTEVTLSQRVTPPEEAAPTAEQPVEYVYVDEPATGRNYKDDDDDDDHDDHDDDDHKSQGRGGRDD